MIFFICKGFKETFLDYFVSTDYLSEEGLKQHFIKNNVELADMWLHKVLIINDFTKFFDQFEMKMDINDNK